MKNILSQQFISLTDKISSPLLDNPQLFDNVRSLLAGNQENTKDFVKTNLLKYKCKTVLDLGCGTGDFSEACPATVKYLGSDLNKNFITYAQKKYANDVNKKFITDDLLKNHEYTSYDAVLLISMMHHFSDKEFLHILKKVHRITKKIVIFADIIPNPPHLIQKAAVALDRGKFVRPKEQKLQIIKKYFTVEKTQIINSRLAVQFGVICRV